MGDFGSYPYSRKTQAETQVVRDQSRGDKRWLELGDGVAEEGTALNWCVSCSENVQSSVEAAEFLQMAGTELTHCVTLGLCSLSRVQLNWV